MKNMTLLILLFVSFHSSSQKDPIQFELKEVKSDSLKQEFIEKNYQMNIILTYFKKNYTVSGEKTNRLFDEEMGGVECAFTQNFKEGISYRFHNCGEASPVKEKIIFPKINLERVKKWVEAVNNAYPMDIKHVWYEGKNEYGPEDEEAGCYYKILPKKDSTIIDIWCGS